MQNKEKDLQCITLDLMRGMSMLPRNKVPNLCQGCDRNRSTNRCPVFQTIKTDDQKKINDSNWTENDEIIAF